MNNSCCNDSNDTFNVLIWFGLEIYETLGIHSHRVNNNKNTIIIFYLVKSIYEHERM